MGQMQTIFDYVAVLVDRDSEGNIKEQKIIKEGRVLSTSQNKVLMAVSRELPEEYKNRLDDIEVTIRPF